MKKLSQPNLTKPYPFDAPGIYEIHAVGEIDDSWPDRLGGMTLLRSETDDVTSLTVSVLIGQLDDQAALAGVLDTLYQNRYPIVYMKYLGPAPTKEPTQEHLGAHQERGG